MWVWSFGMKTSYCWNQHTSVSFPARLFAHDFGPTCSSGNGQPQWPQWWGLWGLSRSHQCGLSLDELSLVWTLTGWWLLRLNLVLDLPEPGPTSGWIWWASWRGQGPLVLMCKTTVYQINVANIFLHQTWIQEVDPDAHDEIHEVHDWTS